MTKFTELKARRDGTGSEAKQLFMYSLETFPDFPLFNRQPLSLSFSNLIIAYPSEAWVKTKSRPTKCVKDTNQCVEIYIFFLQ